MFDYIGKKIKALAIVIFVLGIILSAGVAICVAWEYVLDSLISALLVFLLVLALGFVSSWVSFLLLYGFGELVDQATETNQRLEENHAVLEEILAHMKHKDQRFYDQPRHAEPRPAPVPSKPTEPPTIPTKPRKMSYECEDTAKDSFGDIDSTRLPLRSNPSPKTVKPESSDTDTDSDGDTRYVPKA